MTTIDRNLLMVVLTLVALIALPMAFATARPLFDDLLAFPIVVGIEVLVYFVASLVMNPRATVGMAVGTAVCFTVLRALCSVIGGGLIAIGLSGESADTNFAMPWLNPISGIIQVLILLTAGPYLLAVTIPELVGRKEADRLRSGSMMISTNLTPGAPLETAPTGGFIQVFSYEELAAQLKKNPGLEGFLIYNDEGLVVWRDLPMKVEADTLTARLISHAEAIGGMLQSSGLSRMKRCLIESRDHHVVSAALNQNFGLIVFFSARTPVADINSRLGVITKSTREFLQWKYPALPLATGLTKDRVSVDLA